MKPTAWRMIIIKESTASSKLKTMARRRSSIVKSTAWRRSVKEYTAWRMPTVLSGRWWSRRVQVDKSSQVEVMAKRGPCFKEWEKFIVSN